MKLQLALDRLTRQQCVEIVEEVKDLIDIIEIGTGVIKQYGVGLISDMKERYGDKLILADMKTCDAGRHETIQALSAGADISTVMAFSDAKTIKDALEAAGSMDKQVMVDLLGIEDTNAIARLYDLGARLFSVHIGKDMQEHQGAGLKAAEIISFLHTLHGVEFAYAGGINADSIGQVVAYKPDIVIVGSAITGAVHRREAAHTIREKMI
ncbi:3-hexulose-6-phosphate synthase [Paenibacillus sp. UNCCL117]|uniref:3-hexulose-6-phosphate synthase n=1 Tax=unclassified Paenibacillus TaxID=185978 RepID=UPI0008916245|nr:MULTISPECIES: 3-hexulose-6-phosphate synthase [unclassified Paenibacillus]SDC16746.1 3-hexulose-6-phosphate synthase [Paenibacillus sp. cl123]SFW17860.1 3-hexulose-6-phosphate synthase [Paenibacillus sp. UNCCL117]